MSEEKESHNQETWHDTLTAIWGYNLALAWAARVRGKIDVLQSSHYLGKESIPPAPWKKATIFPPFNSKSYYYVSLYMRNIEENNRVSNNSFTKEAETLFWTSFPIYWSSIKAKRKILSHISVKVFAQEQTVFYSTVTEIVTEHRVTIHPCLPLVVTDYILCLGMIINSAPFISQMFPRFSNRPYCQSIYLYIQIQFICI